MALITLNALRQYQSKSAIREVLGCLINNPSLLATNKITVEDFVEAFHKVVFVAINNCYENGMEKLDSIIIEDYLQNAFPSKYGIFQRNNGALYIEKASEMATMENFSFNYKEMRKFTALRELVKEGVDVSEFFDPNEIDVELADEKRELFENTTVEELLSYYRSKLVKIGEQFTTSTSRESMKAGGNALRKQKEEWKTTPAYGLSYASDFLTTVTYGMREGRFSLYSAGQGTGKTRISCANVCKSFVKRYYKDGQWIDNPHGTQNAVLYIGTEMELLKEIQPILLAYIANVAEDHIIEGRYEEGEEERVDKAIDILDESGIYLEYVPEYNLSLLEQILDYHVTEHKIGHVYFDYIHTTAELLSEYQEQIKVKMQVREDQALANVGLKLKNLSRKYHVSIDSWTQVSGDFKNEQNYDQTIIRGSKALADKIDTGGIVSRPTKKELKLLEKILHSPMHLGKPTPNICYSIYKNRGGKYTRIKIWLYVDYDTMRVHDQFVTDYDYEIITMPQTFIGVDEDQKLIVSNDKKTLTRNLNNATYIMNQIEDDGSIVNEFENTMDINEEEIIKQVIEPDNSDWTEDDFIPYDDDEMIEVDENEVNRELENMSPEQLINLTKNPAQISLDLEDEQEGSETKQTVSKSKKSNKIIKKEEKFEVKVREGSKFTADDFDW